MSTRFQPSWKNRHRYDAAKAENYARKRLNEPPLMLLFPKRSSPRVGVVAPLGPRLGAYAGKGGNRHQKATRKKRITLAPVLS